LAGRAGITLRSDSAVVRPQSKSRSCFKLLARIRTAAWAMAVLLTSLMTISADAALH
jgi:hypothetical protein